MNVQAQNLQQQTQPKTKTDIGPPTPQMQKMISDTSLKMGDMNNFAASKKSPFIVDNPAAVASSQQMIGLQNQQMIDKKAIFSKQMPVPTNLPIANIGQSSALIHGNVNSLGQQSLLLQNNANIVMNYLIY